MSFCNLCPRNCNVDRSINIGFCKCKENAVVAKTMLHHWEEPPISGTKGSGAVFFSGCTLQCVYCQNCEISRGSSGKEYSSDELADLFLKLQDDGAHNINLITPTHFSSAIRYALEKVKHKLKIPVVYNTSGYEKIDTLKTLSGYIDVYLPDFKYFDNAIAEKYSKAPDYFENASNAIKEMYRQVGKYEESADGIAKKGVIVRHLVLPGCRHDSVRILEELKKIVPAENIKLSLMSQFTPDFVSKEYKELSRKITSFEYNYVLEKVIDMGFDGFFQEKNSASAEFTPDFL